MRCFIVFLCCLSCGLLATALHFVTQLACLPSLCFSTHNLEINLWFTSSFPFELTFSFAWLPGVEADGALDKARKHKKRQLEDTLNLVLKKRKVIVAFRNFLLLPFIFLPACMLKQLQCWSSWNLMKSEGRINRIVVICIVCVFFYSAYMAFFLSLINWHLYRYCNHFSLLSLTGIWRQNEGEGWNPCHVQVK